MRSDAGLVIPLDTSARDLADLTFRHDKLRRGRCWRDHDHVWRDYDHVWRDRDHTTGATAINKNGLQGRTSITIVDLK
jgi:hypothetical protein